MGAMTSVTEQASIDYRVTSVIAIARVLL